MTAIARPWPTGAHDATGWTVYDGADKLPRLENRHPQWIEALMGASDDDGDGKWAAEAAGWCGLVRAFFLLMRSEEDARPDEPDHVAWRLGDMKSKWGTLALNSPSATPFQYAAMRFFEVWSGWVCERCGMPGLLRYADYVRPECDECWSRASAKDHETGAKNRPSEPAGETGGHRGVMVGPRSWGTSNSLRIFL